MRRRRYQRAGGLSTPFRYFALTRAVPIITMRHAAHIRFRELLPIRSRRSQCWSDDRGAGLQRRCLFCVGDRSDGVGSLRYRHGAGVCAALQSAALVDHAAPGSPSRIVRAFGVPLLWSLVTGEHRFRCRSRTKVPRHGIRFVARVNRGTDARRPRDGKRRRGSAVSRRVDHWSQHRPSLRGTGGPRTGNDRTSRRRDRRRRYLNHRLLCRLEPLFRSGRVQKRQHRVRRNRHSNDPVLAAVIKA